MKVCALKKGYTPISSSSMSKTAMLLWVGVTESFFKENLQIRYDSLAN